MSNIYWHFQQVETDNFTCVLNDLIQWMFPSFTGPYNLDVTPGGGFMRISWSKPDKVPLIDVLNYKMYFTCNESWTSLRVKGNHHDLYSDFLPATTYRFKICVCLRNAIKGKCSKEKTVHTYCKLFLTSVNIPVPLLTFQWI